MTVTYADDLETVIATMRRLAAAIRSSEVEAGKAMRDALVALDQVGFGWPTSVAHQSLVGDAHLALLHRLTSLLYSLSVLTLDGRFYDLTVGDLLIDAALTLERIGLSLDMRCEVLRTLPDGGGPR